MDDNNTGFWRQLTVREGRAPCKNAEVDNPTNISEVMLIVQVHTVGFDDGQVKDEIECLGQAFYAGSTAESPSLPLTSLVIQAEDVIGLLMKEYLSLTQNQDKVTDTLQNKDSEIKSSEDVVSVDCVTGSEDNSSVDHENGCNASKCLKDEKQFKQFKNIVAIVDPPRVGLHPTVIKVLRTHSRLWRLVYISCNPESLVANAIELCTPSALSTEKGDSKNNRGWKNTSSAGLARCRTKSIPSSEPFKPVKAMAVDLFPHTLHCELVMLMER